MDNPSFIVLIQNAALLLAISLLFDLAPLRWRSYTIGWWQAPFGLLLGGIGILLMLTPWVFTPGIIFDTRSVLLGITGLFFGLVPASIAMLICALFRLYQGGAAAWVGIMVILVSGSTGVAWRYLRKRPLEELTNRELYLFGMVIHLAMLVIMLTLPRETAFEVLSAIGVPVLVIYPLGTLLLGALMINRLKRERINQDLQLRESRLRSMVDILQHRADTTTELMEYALDRAVSLTGSQYGYISFDPQVRQGDKMNTWSTDVKQDCRVLELPKWSDPLGFWGKVAQTRQPVIINDLGEPHPLRMGFPKGHLSLLKYMAVPVFHQEQVVAVVGMANKDSDYEETDALQLTLLMDAVWKAVRWKQAEEALQQSEANYRLLFEQAADGIFIADLEGNFKDVNLNGCSLLGYSREELLALNLKDLILDEDLEENPLQMNRLLVEEQVLVDRRVKHQDGRQIDLEINARLLPDGRLLSVARDISARKRAEAKVQETQDELQRLLEASDQSRRALLSMLEDQKLAQDQIGQLNAELEQRVRNRTIELQIVNDELEAFSYSVSHDLRAPLRAMDGFSDALLSDYPQELDEQGQHFLRRIQEASRQMGRLIEDLLNLSRVTRRELHREVINLSELAEEIAAEFQAQEPERKVKCEIQPCMAVQVDPHLMKIALGNLLSNAFKFTGQQKKPWIQVGMLEKDCQPVYFVRDNGAGFNMSYANKLFAPFQRLHGAKEFPGTGIGLVTVQRIIRRHGGRIWPEAEPDHGACFYFTLEEI